MDALKAAISSGADAVYLGSTKFSARATAENFGKTQLAEAIAICRANGKKAYLAINTLIKDSELSEAIDLAKDAYCFGIDAVVVQDLGFLYALRKLLPDLRIHASTQMTCHNKQGAELLASLGVKRIVLARELSLKEIAEIKDAVAPLGVEIECFVHGAMCFSFSGQCLFSSFVFNKSGNRGRCLQPCRLSYGLRSAADPKDKISGFLLSMKDMMAVDSVPELSKAGIDAFKVEGRLKGPDYVSSVATAYRKAIDASVGEGPGPTQDDIKRMRMSFLRESSSGYFSWNSEMVFPETPGPMGVTAALVLEADRGFLKLKVLEDLSEGDRLAAVNKDSSLTLKVIDITIKGRKLQAVKRGEVAVVKFDASPQVVKGQQLFFVSSKALEKKRSYDVKSATVSGRFKTVDEGSFQRKKSELLNYSGEAAPGGKAQAGINPSGKSQGLVVFLDDEHINPGLVGLLPDAELVCCVPNPGSLAYFKKMLSGKIFRVKAPNVQTSSELVAYEPIFKSEKVVCSNLGAIQLAIKNKSDFWVDRELNVFNSLSARLVTELGAGRIIPSIECSLRELSSNRYGGRLMPLVFFYPLFMTSRAYQKSTALQKKEYVLADRKGFRYKARFDDRRMLRIYNPVPLDMVQEMEKLSGYPSVAIDLTAASQDESLTALENYFKKVTGQKVVRKENTFTKGHYERDVE